MRMTGHKTRSVFDRYDIVSESDLTDAGRKMNALTGTMPGRNFLCATSQRDQSLKKV
jgi:hypothetical protein